MKMLKKFLVLSTFLACCCAVIGQTDDPVLFKVDDIEVPLSEFRYIYEKNNRDGADYTEESLEEYLDLYAKFKLKVKKARDLQLDTIASLQSELEGYRGQLAKSYLNDRQVTDRLTKEAYDRMQKDVRVSHILFRLNRSATEQQRRQVVDNANAIVQRIRNGEDFAQLALEFSQDKSSSSNGGDIGYLTAMLPSGFYEMETAMYSLEPGQVSDPVRTTIGYHIIKVDDVRPARGRVEISHILARVNDSNSNENAAQTKITGIYESLNNDVKFDQLARTASDDVQTAKRGGYIGKVGINEYDAEFEEAAFALESPGDISEPVRTKIGWHVIKLLKKVEVGDYKSERRKLEASMSGNDRMDYARAAMLDRIKEESGFTIDSLELETFVQPLGEDFLTFQWKTPAVLDKAILSFGDGASRSVEEFAQYAFSRAKFRMRSVNPKSPQETAYELFDMFANEACVQHEESILSEKYPEFSALLREYEEGILLFEITKMEVWDKATSDSAGLQEYYDLNKNNYQWPERAEVVSYRVNSQDDKTLVKAYKTSGEMTPKAWAESLNKEQDIAAYDVQLKKREEVEEAGWEWAVGFSTSMLRDPNLGVSYTRVVSIVPPKIKELAEARGYVIADYQDHLENEWVKELSTEYSVVVNEDLLKSLVRK